MHEFTKRSWWDTGSWVGFGGGGHLYFRLDIILVKELSKHTLSTYFSSMKIDPKYVFLHVFLNLSVMFFPKLVKMAKNTPFFQILHVFAPPKRYTPVHCLVLKNNPNYVNFFMPRLYRWGIVYELPGASCRKIEFNIYKYSVSSNSHDLIEWFECALLAFQGLQKLSLRM